MPFWLRAFLVAYATGLLLGITACNDNPSGSVGALQTAPTAVSAAHDTMPAAAPPGTSLQLPQRTDPDPGRAMQHLQALAGDIGSRPATTDNERRAAGYIRQQLEAAGYQVSIEEFNVQVTRGGSATLRVPGGTVEAAPLGGSPNGASSGQLVAAGLGRTSDIATAQVSGNVVLLDRGEITFAEKVRNAQAAGAVAVIVVNNQPGLFRGDLGGEAISIPSVGVAQEARTTFDQIRDASGSVDIEVQTDRVSGTSQNVVARPSDKPCTAYLGAHYDSVPAGPGANDNASGTSLMIELARARRFEGLCVVAFGAEEVGLLGSRAYVRDHDVRGAAFMMNFDMVAKMTSPTFIGDQSLTAEAVRLAADHGIDARTVASFGPGTSSDHASFQTASVPVLMFYSGDDQFIHTGQDDVGNVSQDDIEKLLDVAAAMIDRLLGV